METLFVLKPDHTIVPFPSVFPSLLPFFQWVVNFCFLFDCMYMPIAALMYSDAAFAAALHMLNTSRLSGPLVDSNLSLPH